MILYKRDKISCTDSGKTHTHTLCLPVPAVRLHYLPGCEAQSAHEVTAGFNLDVFVVLGADFTKLEGGAHFAVQLVLLLLSHTARSVSHRRSLHHGRTDGRTAEQTTRHRGSACIKGGRRVSAQSGSASLSICIWQ